MRARFLWHLSYLERVQGVLDGVPRGPVGPPGPLELSALDDTVPAAGRALLHVEVVDGVPEHHLHRGEHRAVLERERCQAIFSTPIIP